ncbi:Cytochrome C oxidase, cbb3-type, subunit III [Thalassococcus halodurans]|jgi:mono/diheme cytochrome c family protein|uniref:Cytochrome C oxidase, cbb3-type, subunit III n=1 Tax=Thalassococcus halodurans TaxID=373675 RepID=A0A1H5RWP3_9RHOB|nr:Cytochrome C oxidase, cbb3-type, subunit III [Thalassococcus halodurans]
MQVFHSLKRGAIAAGALALVAGCQMDGTTGGPSHRMPDANDGKGIYMEYCSACHGETGIGDGPMARAMSKPPKNLTLLSVRHNDTFPKAKVMSIVDGYARSDLSGPGMPQFGELLAGDLVPFDSGDGIATPTPRRLVALVEYLENIQKLR